MAVDLTGIRAVHAMTRRPPRLPIGSTWRRRGLGAVVTLEDTK